MRGAGLERGPARHRLDSCRPRQARECAKGDGRLGEDGPRGGSHRRGVRGRQACRKGISRVPPARRKGGAIPSTARYRIGSQTKTMTATAVLQLVKEGKLSLDDELSEVLPKVRKRP
ncbi:serine hydrolase [Nonomuraea sp. NPDC049028]|uniref:serine hydrolase n=1 Tax=Nonomuraea sp. NPDC049028 TaxID=3364348 RepID=UPI00371FA8CC